MVIAAVASLVVLAACSKKDGGGTQVAAKVNKEEISVHQVNFILQRQPGLKPEQVPLASRRVLEGLIDQELAVQQAHEQKLDRDPRIVMAIDAARRDILARAYADKLGETAAKPTDEQIQKYFAANPGLFSQRRIYGLSEILVQADNGQAAALQGKLEATKTSDEAASALRAMNAKFNARRINEPAENLPLALVNKLAPMQEGQKLISAQGNMLSVIYVQSAKSAPVSEPQAKPLIAQFLLNQEKRKLMVDGMKSLRQSSKIEYAGQFAEGAASAVAPAAPSPAASAELDANALQKGISGLK